MQLNTVPISKRAHVIDAKEVLRPNLVHGITTELCWDPANAIALGITEGRVYLGVTRTGLIIRNRRKRRCK